MGIFEFLRKPPAQESQPKPPQQEEKTITAEEKFIQEYKSKLLEGVPVKDSQGREGRITGFSDDGVFTVRFKAQDGSELQSRLSAVEVYFKGIYPSEDPALEAKIGELGWGDLVRRAGSENKPVFLRKAQGEGVVDQRFMVSLMPDGKLILTLEGIDASSRQAGPSYIVDSIVAIKNKRLELG